MISLQNIIPTDLSHSILNRKRLLNFLKETILHLMFNKNDFLKILLFLFKAGFQKFKGPKSRLLCCTAISWMTEAIARMKASGSY